MDILGTVLVSKVHLSVFCKSHDMIPVFASTSWIARYGFPRRMSCATASCQNVATIEEMNFLIGLVAIPTLMCS